MSSSTRHAPRRARWYLICSHPAVTAWGTILDADDTVECWTLTRRGAQHLAKAFQPPPGGRYSVVRRRDWEAEHS